MIERWVLSCEHGGHEIPQAYRSLFTEADEVLNTHRGWDPGALALFRLLEPLAYFSHSSTTSRLLVELNRSVHHPNLFSAYTRALSLSKKEQILAEVYYPYRRHIEEAINSFTEQKQLVKHLSIHSFTPVMDGDVRKADIGLLYDPARETEKKLCAAWKALLLEKLPHFVIRFNYPYRGTADGFTTYLRKKHPISYAGVEFELNQRWAGNELVYGAIYDSLEQLRENHP